MNEIKLLPHNQKLFDEIMEAINNGEHSIFYSQATGLGKSFIFMRLVQDLFSGKGKKVLYIVPKIAIWDNLNMYDEFKYVKENVVMATYADFNLIKIHHYDYDAIFIDECHHLISDIQGSNILKLCKEYVEAGRYIFGFTATPAVLNPDKNIHVGEYFNYQAYGYNLIEAIHSGLFNKIDYTIAIPDIEISEEYRKKYSINGTKNLLENILDERSDIMHWLIYFSNIEDLKKNILSLKKLLPDYKIFFMHSKNKESFNDKQLREFNNYKGKSMLLTVSMVLEGIHPKNVGGILLYRNITRRNTLLQVLGRICDIDKKNKPLCVDIPNAINNASYYIIKETIDNEDGEDDNNEDFNYERNIRSIIDVKASSYRYIELVSDILGNLFEKGSEYRGYIWKSKADLSRQLGLGNSGIYNLLHTHKYNSCEEIIDAKLNGTLQINPPNITKTYRGISYTNKADLARQLDIDQFEMYNLLNSGEYNSCEEIIDAKLDGTLLTPTMKKRINTKTYRGISYINKTDLSKQLGLGYYGVYKLLNSGEYNSCEEIIDAKLDDKLKYEKKHRKPYSKKKKKDEGDDKND